MQSAVTSSSGHYSFRFSNPGTFTLTVTPPAVYQAPATISLKRPSTLGGLEQTRGLELPGRALGGGAPGERFG